MTASNMLLVNLDQPVDHANTAVETFPPDVDKLLEQIDHEADKALRSLKHGRSYDTADRLETIMGLISVHRKLSANSNAGQGPPF